MALSSDSARLPDGFELVHTVSGYYDGPRSGIADFHGRPHAYESMFEEDWQQRDVFLLKPIDDETFQLAMEDWEIWCRWERAFHEQRATRETHPALPEDRARHEELEGLLAERLDVKPDEALRVKGEFDVLPSGEPGLTSSVRWIVRWM